MAQWLLVLVFDPQTIVTRSIDEKPMHYGSGVMPRASTQLKKCL